MVTEYDEYQVTYIGLRRGKQVPVTSAPVKDPGAARASLSRIRRWQAAQRGAVPLDAAGTIRHVHITVSGWESLTW